MGAWSFIPLLAMMFSAVAIALLRRPAAAVGLADKPGGRKQHKGVVPLTGGLGVFIGFLLVQPFLPVEQGGFGPLLAGMALLVACGVIDDARDMRSTVKLGVQLVASVLMVVWGGQVIGLLGVFPLVGELRLGWLAVPVTVVAVAGLIALAIVKDRDSRQHRELAEWHRSLFVNHPDGVYVFDLDGRFQRCNEALERISGYPEKALLGRHFNEFIHAEYHEQTQAAFDAAKAGASRHYETLGIHANGKPHYLEITNFPVTFDGRIVGVYGICHDITHRKRQAAKIAYQATHDLLTGLPNQTVLDERLENEFRQSRQSQRLLSVLYLDLDGFKAINDCLGHTVGNQLLVAVAGRLRQLLRPGDTLVRLNGDEFVFLLPGFSSREEVAAAAEGVLLTLELPFEIGGRALHISTSIGVACSDENIHKATDLIQHADMAVEAAKRQGRNTWQWYRGEDGQSVNQHVLLRYDLHAALRENQFELFYQPIVDAVSGQIHSVEALVRWHHPRHGMVSPGIFIPIAEQTGQIIPLGRWVLRQACQDLADLRAEGEWVFPVAVNISSLQFHREGFLEEVQRILDETGLPPELLELEVTESILMGGAKQAIEMISTLRGMRIAVTIDDFGTGFSSLSYLRDLPIHKIKLDRAFIRDVLTNQRNAALVKGIITMAHHMGLEVVAEGIEEQEQQWDLVRRRCDLLQGFYFARPMPLGDLLKLPDILPVAD